MIDPPSGDTTGSYSTMITLLTITESNSATRGDPYFCTSYYLTQQSINDPSDYSSGEPARLPFTAPYKAPSDAPSGSPTHIPRKYPIRDTISNTISYPNYLKLGIQESNTVIISSDGAT